ncbi:MAG: hypothetical protein MJ131_04875 [Lachnospiraceae bacterium]|nr:hypothetical protein [Lachnospiraceae bacterium]
MAIQEYKCPCCAGAIEFNSTVGKMKCPYCDSEFEMDSLKELDDVLANEIVDNMDWNTSAGEDFNDAEANGMSAYSCQSCGAQILTDKTTAASSCPFCGNQIIMMNNLAGALKPDLLIPFKFNKEQAKEALKKHFEGKKLLPSSFKDQNHIDEISGVYVPFWLFNSKASADFRYKGIKEKRWSDDDYDYIEKSYYSVIRRGGLEFANVPCDASQKMDDALMDSLEPYDYSQAVDFQTAYLAGYLADKYDVTAEDSTERANNRIRRSTEIEFRKTVTGYDSVETQNKNINLENGTTRYAQLPMWILNTTWNNEKYVFGMNGQTGKFVGNLPMDKGKFWKYFAIIGLIGAAIGGLGSFFLLDSGMGAVIGIAVVIGLLAGFIGTLSMRSELKSVRIADAAQNFIKQGSFKLNDSRDIYMYRKVERRAKPKPQQDSQS